MALWFFVSFSFSTMGSRLAYKQGFVKADPASFRSLDDFNGFLQREFGLSKISRPGTPDRYGQVTINILSFVPATSGFYHAQFESSVLNRQVRSCSAMLYIDFDAIHKMDELKEALMNDYNQRNPSPYSIDKREGCFITSLCRIR